MNDWLRYTTRRLCSKQKFITKKCIDHINTRFFRHNRDMFISVLGIPYLLEREGLYGDTEHCDECTFRIRIDTERPYDEFTKTLLHELVHVKQFAQKKLIHHQRNSNRFTWKCDKTKRVYRGNYSDLSYEDYPWEIEAIEYEHILFKEVKPSISEVLKW